MPDRARNPVGRPLGRTELMLEDESSCRVVVLDFVCRCDDITVKFGSQTVAVVERRRFTSWIWNGGFLEADDLVLSREGGTVFAVVNGGRRCLMPAVNVGKLTELIANSG